MDYRDVEWFEPVAKGQKLAFYHSAKQGENGTTIKGQGDTGTTWQRKYKPEIRNTMDLYFKVESAIYTKEKQMETLLSAKDKLEEELKKSCNACAIVNAQNGKEALRILA